MFTRPEPERAPEATTPVTHRVDGPQHYENWREYAFSDAPELDEGTAQAN